MKDIERERKRPNVKEKGEEQRLMELMGYKNIYMHIYIYRKGKEAAIRHGGESNGSWEEAGKKDNDVCV